ncbi:Ig heavy chain V region MC101, partial [Sigmodon hispidus]
AMSQGQLKESLPGLIQTSETLFLTYIFSVFSLTCYGIHCVQQPSSNCLEW